MDDRTVRLGQGADSGKEGAVIRLRGGGLLRILQGGVVTPPAPEIAGAVQRSPEEPRFLMLPVPETGSAGQYPEKDVLDRVLRVGGSGSPGKAARRSMGL